MSKLNNQSLLAATTILVALFCSPAMGGEFVPLKGTFEGVGPEFGGNFTHLGKFTGLVTSIDGFESTAVWTAANGDTVANEALLILGPQISPGVFLYEQLILITGGTGRFENAIGYAEVVGTIDFDTGAYDGDLDGRISRPNSRR